MLFQHLVQFFRDLLDIFGLSSEPSLFVQDRIGGNRGKPELLDDLTLLIVAGWIREFVLCAELFQARGWVVFLDGKRENLNALALVLLPHFFF